MAFSKATDYNWQTLFIVNQVYGHSKYFINKIFKKLMYNLCNKNITLMITKIS